MKKLFKSKNTKMIIAMLMVIAMIATIIPMALAEEPEGPGTEPTDNATQINATNATNTNKAESTLGSDGVEVTLDKNIYSTETENEFIIGLKVTSTNKFEQPEDVDLAVSVVLDCSGSMGSAGAAALKSAVDTFIDAYAASSEGGARWLSVVKYSNAASKVTFGGSDWIDVAVSGNAGAAKSVITTSSNGYTNTAAALNMAKVLVDGFTETVDSESIILMTDGEPRYSNENDYKSPGSQSKADAMTAANAIRNAGIDLYGVYYDTSNSDSAASQASKDWYKYTLFAGCDDMIFESSNIDGDGGLAANFIAIYDSIRAQFSNVNSVVDIMGDYIDIVEIIECSNDRASYIGDTLTWYLFGEGDDDTLPTEGLYIYTMTYRVTLDTDAIAKAGITLDAAGDANERTRWFDTNESATLYYYFSNTAGDRFPATGFAELPVASPKVRGFAAELSFDKRNELGEVVTGAKFELEKTGYSPKATSDSTGVVSFKNIPYGDYTLVETEAPSTNVKSDSEVTVSVNYGVIVVDIDAEETLEKLFVNNRKFENEYIDISVVKEWTDEAPEDWKVVVELYRDGDATGVTRTLNEDTPNDVFKDLPLYADLAAMDSDTKHVYTVVEIEINGEEIALANGFDKPVIVAGEADEDGNFTVTITNKIADEIKYNVVVKYFYRTGANAYTYAGTSYDVLTTDYADGDAYDVTANAPSAKTFGSTSYSFASSDVLTGNIDAANVVVNVYYQNSGSIPFDPPTTTPETPDEPTPTPPVEETEIDDEGPILSEFEPEPEPETEPEEEFEEEIPLAEAPATGDPAIMTVAAVLALLAVAGIVIVLTTKKREN